MNHHTTDVLCLLCEEKLSAAHPDLVAWYRGVKEQRPEVHVSWAYRDEQNQNQCVSDGRSKLVFPNSPHNKTPAEALDLFQLIGGAKFDPKFYADLASSLPENIFWGGKWKTLGDGDHFQLRVNLPI